MATTEERTKEIEGMRQDYLRANDANLFQGQFADWTALTHEQRMNIIVMLQSATDYVLNQTQVPPNLVEREGKWYVQLHFGNETYEAPIGYWFLKQLFERMAIPKLLRD